MTRPTGVTIMAVVAIIGGVIGLLASLAYLGVPMVQLFGPIGIVGGTASVLTFSVGGATVLFGIAALVFGIGALRLRPWAWTLGVVLYALDLLAALALILTGAVTAGTLVAAVVSIVLLGYLYSHSVREAFGHEPGHGMVSGTHGPSHA